MNKLYSRLLSWMRRSTPSTDRATPAPAAPPVLSGPRDRAVAALLYAIYFTMVAFTGFSVYIVFFIIIQPPTPPPTPPPQCSEDRAETCPEGMGCDGGVCVTLLNPDCREGDPCDGCSCNLPMTCAADGKCQTPAPAAPVACNEELRTFVEHLVEYQAKCVTDADGKPLETCPTENVSDFLLSHGDFDALLSKFPDGVMVMFPIARPALGADVESEDAKAWPDELTLKAYQKTFLDRADTWRNAGYIISIGRASLTQGGKKVATADYNYAQSRVRFVRKLLLETLAPETTQQTELSSKFIEFVLGTERPLTLETFSAMPQATVWWSENASRNVSQALKDLKPGKPSPGRSVAENDINRSVALFAVPRECLRLP